MKPLARPLLLGLLVAVTALAVALPGRAQGRATATLVLEISGDLSQGALLRVASLAVPGVPGAMLRRVWWTQAPSVQLPSGKTVLPGGMPIGLKVQIRGARVQSQAAHLVETSRQRTAFGLLGLETVTTMNYFPFKRLDDER